MHRAALLTDPAPLFVPCHCHSAERLQGLVAEETGMAQKRERLQDNVNRLIAARKLLDGA